MPDIFSIPGLRELWRLTLGDPAICVAVLDGPAVLDHPCLRGANVRRLRSYWWEEGAEVEDGIVEHATHVCSTLFSPHNTEVKGIAPGCCGLNIPIQAGGLTDTYQLVRAIDAARDAGANIIHVAFVQPTQSGSAEYVLERAVQTCLEEGILVVSPAGNDKGECWTMPSAIPGVLAVGAMRDDGQPFKFSNFGGVLQSQGVLAPGENILAADSAGGVLKHKGTSCAAPIVTGVAALLMSLQRRQGRQPSAVEVRQAILDSAIPCDPREVAEPERCLRGKLNIAGAVKIVLGSSENVAQPAEVARLPVKSSGANRATWAGCATVAGQVSSVQGVSAAEMNDSSVAPDQRRTAMAGKTADATGAAKAKLVYALGTISYDFGTEARRDTFKQRMPLVTIGATTVPANPYDPRQMAAYLAANPDEARSLIWTVNQEQTPIYALKPVGSFGHQTYETLRLLLAGEVEAAGSEHYIERVSLPGERTNETLRLFSGQQVPVVRMRTPRGLYGWQVKALIEDTLAAAAPDLAAPDLAAPDLAAPDLAAPDLNEAERSRLRRALRSFLDHIYHELKNSGVSAKDRALNFAATNAFQAAEAFAMALSEGRELKSLEVVKSPVCRLNSDCWDVKLKFFDPDHGQRANRVCRFTIDVSDALPVTLGEVRTWLTRD